MDKDMNILMKNFRENFMQQVKDHEKIHPTLDLSNDDSESWMDNTRQITSLSVPDYV